MTFRTFAATVAIAFSIPLHAAEDTVKPYRFGNATERIISSSAGAGYRIMVFVPEGKAPEGGHPVTYVLDGDDLFPAVVSLLRLQAGTGKASKHNGITPGIVVGIGYPETSRRDLDYTPKAPADRPETYRDGRPYPSRPGGGADEFFSFIEKDLKPLVQKEHAIDTSRQTLLGAGYGGLFALHVLFTKPDAFQTYVAASPSIWWNNGYILTEESSFTRRLADIPVKAKLVLSVGEMEQSLSKVELAWPDENEREEHRLKVTRRKMVDHVREMGWRLEPLTARGLATDLTIFPGETHKSVTPLSLNHALPFMFPSGL